MSREWKSPSPVAAALGLFCAAVCSTAWAEGQVLLIPSVGTVSAVTLSGRVWKAAPTQGSSTLSKNVRRLLASGWKGARVEVRFADQVASVKADGDGAFSASFASKSSFAPGTQVAEARVDGAKPGVAVVEVVGPEAPFFVVSDFDDTVAVTHVLDKSELFESALLKDETTQAAVPGMSELYNCLKQEKPAPPVFALVSGSPIQYVPRIDAFLKRYKFPLMGLYLRDLSPQTLHDYKQPHLRALLKSLSQKVVLIGDSGEHDPEVYAQMAAEFPDRVLATYIRNAGRAEDLSRFSNAMLFAEPKEAALDAVKKGLITQRCVEASFP